MKVTAKQYARAFVETVHGANAKQLSEASAQFVKTVAEHGDLHRMSDIVRNVDAAWKEKFGAANVHVTTAHPLSKELRISLEQLAQGATIHETVDPELIGGARIRIDDRLIDGSVAGKLAALKNALAE